MIELAMVCWLLSSGDEVCMTTPVPRWAATEIAGPSGVVVAVPLPELKPGKPKAQTIECIGCRYA